MPFAFNLRSKLPDRRQAVPVFSVIVTITYTWTLLSLFHQLGFWSEFLLLHELLAISSYLFIANLLESIVFFIGLLLAGIFLPHHWFLDKFTYRGSLLSILIFGYLMYFATRFTVLDKYPTKAVNQFPYMIIGIFLIAYLLERIPYLQKVIEFIADRTVIFLYIYIPISVISLLSILIRSIF